MIVFFPKIYDDELAYSVFARYHVYSGHPSYRATAIDLFLSTATHPSREFTIALSDKARKVIEMQMPIEEFIENHTMFPYYIRFLPLDRRKKAIEVTMAMDKSMVDYMLFKRAKNCKLFRYCPLCASEDREKYGETYWHRVHQLPEVEVCHKHHCRLKESDIDITAANMTYYMTHAEIVVPQEVSADFSVTEIECKVAEYVIQLFSAKVDCENNGAVGQYLHHKLKGTPYTSMRGENVFARKLLAALREYYAGLPNFPFPEWWHVQKVFVSQSFHTFDVCLIAMFLGVSASELINMSTPEESLCKKFDEQVIELHNQGKTYKQIAEIMGVTLHTIKEIGAKWNRAQKESKENIT